MKRLLPFLILLITFSSCKNETKPEEPKEDTELKELLHQSAHLYQSNF